MADPQMHMYEVMEWLKFKSKYLYASVKGPKNLKSFYRKHDKNYWVEHIDFCSFTYVESHVQSSFL